MIDYSTIDIDRLKKYQTYILPMTYRLQRGMGNGCFLDPPGYPTYFTRHVYTQHGNDPWRGPQMVITYNSRHYVVDSLPDHNRCEVKSWDRRHKSFQNRMRKLWLPLPIGHPRTQAWISYCSGYFKNCYEDPRKDENKRKYAGEVKIGPWSTKEVIEVAPLLGLEVPIVLLGREDYELFYTDMKLALPLADLGAAVENLTYRPLTYIRQWYPEYDPWLHGREPGYGTVGDWWEIWDHRPSPDECPGKDWAKHGQYDYCQFCGWRRENDGTVA